ncbi:MAG: hypothetical protein ACKOW2_08425 [Sphingobacteriaceae bacterium]
MKFSQVVTYFVIFLVVLAAGPYWLQTKNPDYLISLFWKLYVLFAGFTLLVLAIAFWRMKVSDKASGQVLLATVVSRLLFCMILLFVYLSNFNVNGTVFVLNFFYLYLTHTVFEIYCLLRNLRT